MSGEAPAYVVESWPLTPAVAHCSPRQVLDAVMYNPEVRYGPRKKVLNPHLPRSHPLNTMHTTGSKPAAKRKAAGDDPHIVAATKFQSIVRGHRARVRTARLRDSRHNTRTAHATHARRSRAHAPATRTPSPDPAPERLVNYQTFFNKLQRLWALPVKCVARADACIE